MLHPTMSVKIAKRAMEAADVVLLELVDPAGEALPPFGAGSHIDVEVRPGLVRQYSLCNAPDERHRYRIAVLLERGGRGGSAAMHALTEGSLLRISAPRNHFALDNGAPRSLLFAGGIGVTPILCMAERLSAIGAEFAMHYASRTPARAPFRDHIARSRFADRVDFYFSRDESGGRPDLDAIVSSAGLETHVYVCGPAPFIEAVLAAAARRGIPDQQVHREYFAMNDAQLGDSAAFQVKLASSGVVLDIPEDATVVDVLREHGFDLPTSCEQGVCGTCLTRVLEGLPDHRDYFLTNEERERNDRFTPCCSRAKSTMLVIDL